MVMGGEGAEAGTSLSGRSSGTALAKVSAEIKSDSVQSLKMFDSYSATSKSALDFKSLIKDFVISLGELLAAATERKRMQKREYA